MPPPVVPTQRFPASSSQNALTTFSLRLRVSPRAVLEMRELVQPPVVARYPSPERPAPDAASPVPEQCHHIVVAEAFGVIGIMLYSHEIDCRRASRSVNPPLEVPIQYVPLSSSMTPVTRSCSSFFPRGRRICGSVQTCPARDHTCPGLLPTSRSRGGQVRSSYRDQTALSLTDPPVRFWRHVACARPGVAVKPVEPVPCANPQVSPPVFDDA